MTPYHITHPISLCILDDLSEVCNSTLSVWVLEEHSTRIPVGEVDLCNIPNQYLQAQRNGSCLHHSQGLRMHLIREVDFAPLVLSVEDGWDESV